MTVGGPGVRRGSAVGRAAVLAAGWSFALAGGLSGCGRTGLSNRPDVVEDSASDTPVGIDALDPNWSLPDEATAVTITGHGFQGAVTVDFGRAEADASVLDDQTIVVTAPAAGMETTVDVTVHTALGDATLPDGFTWSADEPVDTGDTGGGDTGDTSGAGQTGGLVEFSLLQIACPSCLGYTSDLQVVATAGFHQPTPKSWVSWLPAKGTCVTDPAPTQASTAFLDAGSRLWLEYGPDDHPDVSVALDEDAGVYGADGLTADDFVRTAGYRVEVAGGGDVPAFTAENAFYTPDSISALTPMEMLYSDPRSAFAAKIKKSAADFTWSSNGGNDGFAVVIDAYNASSGAPLGEVFCYDGDSGSMRVPSNYLSGFPSGSLLVIGMYRYAVDRFVRPDNGSDVQTVITFGVLGTGVLAN